MVTILHFGQQKGAYGISPKPLCYALEGWQERQGSNPRPSVLETDALPAELRSYLT